MHRAVLTGSASVRHWRSRRHSAAGTGARARSPAGRRNGPARRSRPRGRDREQHARRRLARKAHLVRHDHHGHAFAGKIAHHHQHLADQLGIERAGRLVEQQEIRTHGAARARCRRAASARPTVSPGRRRACRTSPTLASSASASSRTSAFGRFCTWTGASIEVLQHGEVRPQREVLKHHADARA